MLITGCLEKMWFKIPNLPQMLTRFQGDVVGVIEANFLDFRFDQLKVLNLPPHTHTPIQITITSSTKLGLLMEENFLMEPFITAETSLCTGMLRSRY